MADITHGTWIKDGKAVDKVFSNGRQVYSRNLLKGTKTPNSLTGSNILNQGGTIYYFANGKNIQNQGLSIGDTLTCEFDWIVSNSTSGLFYIQINATNWQKLSEQISITSANNSGHSKFSFVVDAGFLSGGPNGIRIRADYLPTNSVITISNASFTKGSVAIWSLAPEDYI